MRCRCSKPNDLILMLEFTVLTSKNRTRTKPSFVHRYSAYGRRHCLGVGMIEVLVSILILSLGLLGTAALVSTSLRNNQSAAERTLATILTYSMIDALRANRVTALNGGYNHAMIDCIPAASPSSLPEREISHWLTTMQTELSPTACGNVNCTGGLCTVQIEWDDTRATAGEAQFRVETEVRL